MLLLMCAVCDDCSELVANLFLHYIALFIFIFNRIHCSVFLVNLEVP